jgi:hypothetical protein
VIIDLGKSDIGWKRSENIHLVYELFSVFLRGDFATKAISVTINIVVNLGKSTGGYGIEYNLCG